MKYKIGLNDIISTLGIIACLSLGGLIYQDLYRYTVRDRIVKYLNETKRTSYSTKIGSCTVTVNKNVLDTNLKLTVEKLLPNNPKEYKKIEFIDNADSCIGRKFKGIEYLIIDGERIDADDVPKDSLKPYEEMMDEKLKDIEPELKNLAAERKLILEKQKKEEKEKTTEKLKKHLDDLSDMCSNPE